jgi:glycosyltransferase involved in cell wall biosynthesis
VLPSLSEGLPQTMLEAMSYGLPVIATKVGGIPDVIEHAKTGFLIEPGNSEEIKKYIEILLEDEKLCEEMRDNCLREIQKYSWDHTVKRFEEVMRRSVESNKANC